MTLALSHRLPLNGNKLALLAVLLLFSCSPKVVPVKKPDGIAEKPVEKEIPVAKTKKFDLANIALLLPFQLKKDPAKYGKADVEDAQMAIDFYQGFKLGLDSVAASGQHFKLNVIDTKAASNAMAEILRRDEVVKANLIVGPVFPESIKQLNRNATANFVSPLAATRPEEFNNPGLISIVPNINLHAKRMSDFIISKYATQQKEVVLINPKNADSEQFAADIRRNLSATGRLDGYAEYPAIDRFENQLRNDIKYVVIITSPDRAFVLSALDKLTKLKAKYKLQIDVYGHPTWAKQTYPTEQLQGLNVTLTSSYYVNYKRSAVISFVKRFRELYGFEPSEYAVKGFDTGYYFAKLMAKHGPDYMNYLTREKFEGLHNGFTFVKDDKLGFLNTDLKVVRYKNFQLVALD